MASFPASIVGSVSGLLRYDYPAWTRGRARSCRLGTLETMDQARTKELLRERFGDDVALTAISPHADSRGRLIAFDTDAVPFPVRRIFAVSGVPAGEVRGGHSHRTCVQLLVCLTGHIEVELRKGDAQLEVTLTPQAGSLGIGPGVWSSQRYVHEGSVLLVLASEPYDPASHEGQDGGRGLGPR
jgi:hypothetical protein